MPLLELSMWCAARFPGNSENCSLLIDHSNQQLEITLQRIPRSGNDRALHQQSPTPSRRFDIPWMVLDPTLAAETWDWSPATPLPDILEEIAQHAESNPTWLDMVT